MHLSKKKIMLVVCYLLVIMGMLMTITWARYKKDLKGEILVSEAADFRASMHLNDNDNNLTVWMTDFRPGETAENNQAAERHGYKFKVDNRSSGDISDKPIGYTIRVYGKGHIPLSMILYDEKSKTSYYGTKTNVSEGILYTFNDVAENVIQKEHEFFLGAKEFDENQFTLYIGWQAFGEAEDYDDRKYMKEVELLEIRAVVRATSTGLEAPETAPEAVDHSK